ncbi:hypothetical protein [Pseudomonas sp. 2(2015)]|uniref:hypothetical protein n=1 Tax=Pseudomonas sp. 2(2015) TaxID=1619950 RepID=UPI0005EAE47F|nr:hypothetical protein [Pseudomonas sp. 2(2015)]KJK14852.1 hypothetical protein UB48_23955 [Pseudomonas sp. 2(2015)]
MTKALEYGKDLWLMLAPTFDQATALDGHSGYREKGQAFAGFIAAVAGTMCAQIGTDAARAVLEVTAQGLPSIERATLKAVTP